jgi:3-methyladenine DNA glycosylase/8-oxoguanine DNA glycosylase
VAQANEQFSALGAESKALAAGWIGQFTAWDVRSDDEIARVRAQINDFVEKVASDPQIQASAQKLFALDPKAMPAEDWATQARRYADEIAAALSLSDDQKNRLLLERLQHRVQQHQERPPNAPERRFSLSRNGGL